MYRQSMNLDLHLSLIDFSHSSSSSSSPMMPQSLASLAKASTTSSWMRLMDMESTASPRRT